MKWKQILNPLGNIPLSRHGHRAVVINDSMVIFGGGNDKILNDVYVYSPEKDNWKKPVVKGEVPSGFAAHGMCADGCKILVFGGMLEYGRYSNALYELNTSLWEWKALKPKPSTNRHFPCPRLGHSFTSIDNKVYLFGGLENRSDDPKNNVIRYLNDLWVLDLRQRNLIQWEVPQTYGTSPSPRESHSAVVVSYQDGRSCKLIIFGGMNGQRLNDLWILNIDSLTWNKPYINGSAPIPRSLHTATLIGSEMFIFGGSAQHSDKKLQCINDLTILNIELLSWQNANMNAHDDKPKCRAGHCAVEIHNRLWIWSGRDGYRNQWKDQVCHSDLWYLETCKPTAPEKVQIVSASETCLNLTWGMVPREEGYILQIQKYFLPSHRKNSHSSQNPETNCHMLQVSNYDRIDDLQSASEENFSTSSSLHLEKQIHAALPVFDEIGPSLVSGQVTRGCEIKAVQTIKEEEPKIEVIFDGSIIDINEIGEDMSSLCDNVSLQTAMDTQAEKSKFSDF